MRRDDRTSRKDPCGAGRRTHTRVALACGLLAAFGAGALVVLDVQAAIGRPTPVGEFYALALALVCTCTLGAVGALVVRAAQAPVLAELAAVRNQLDGISRTLKGYGEGVVAGLELAGNESPESENATVTQLPPQRRR